MESESNPREDLANNQIMIVCNNKLLLNERDRWKYTQRLKVLQDEALDNEYYSDSFLSKQILEVLKNYSDENNISITYLNNYKTDKIKFGKEVDKDLFSVDKKGNKKIQKNINIKDININDLNTFATSETLTEIQTAHAVRESEVVKHIEVGINFPTKLIFEVTPEKDIKDFDVKIFETMVNNEIDERINKKLSEDYSTIKKQVQDLEKAKREREREREREIEEERELLRISKYLDQEIPESPGRWKYIFKSYLLEAQQIEKQIEDYKKQTENAMTTDDSASGSGGKKSKKLPKKEILGKTKSIHKIPGDRKEYVKHKSKLITVNSYKELIKKKR